MLVVYSRYLWVCGLIGGVQVHFSFKYTEVGSLKNENKLIIKFDYIRFFKALKIEQKKTGM